MYIARQLTSATLEEIGREFGNRHHSTTLHSIRKIEEMCRSDDALDFAIKRLMDDITLRLAGILGCAAVGTEVRTGNCKTHISY
jgi:hypothetical protein